MYCESFYLFYDFEQSIMSGLDPIQSLENIIIAEVTNKLELLNVVKMEWHWLANYHTNHTDHILKVNKQ